MICRTCKHAIVGTTKIDQEMATMGYRTCAKARNEVERAMFFKGESKCRWPERNKEIARVR